MTAFAPTAPAALPRRAALAAMLGLTACGPTRLAPLTGPSRGRIVLLRGLANMFSTGLNVLTAELRVRNFDASVHNYLEWRGLAAAILAASRDDALVRPLAIMGHSFGADDAVVMANHLGRQGVAVDLLVTFDPTGAEPLGPGVLRALNFWQGRDRDFVRTLAAGPGFTGTIENRLVPGESHLSIEKQEQLHAVVIAMLESLVAAPAMAAAAPPAAAAPLTHTPPPAPLPRPPRPPLRAER